MDEALRLHLNDFRDMSGDKVHEKVFEITQPYLGTGRILVTGAGEGAFESRLIRAGVSPERISALDIRPHKYKLRQVTCGQADLNDSIPFADELFDTCYSIEVIEHLERPKRLIDEAYRVLKPGGILALTTPNVHSLMQKLRFLFTDRLAWFEQVDYFGSGHIHPLLDATLGWFCRDRFERVHYDSNKFHFRLPKLPSIPMPKHRLFAVNNIYVLKRL